MAENATELNKSAVKNSHVFFIIVAPKVCHKLVLKSESKLFRLHLQHNDNESHLFHLQ